jgi:hypothetical protein
LLGLGIWLLIQAAVSAVVFWLGDQKIAVSVGFVCLFLALAGGVVSRIYEARRPDGSRRRVSDVIGGLLLMAFFTTFTLFAGAYFLPGTSQVYVDNYSSTDVALELDGKPWTSAARNTTQMVAMRTGDHIVIVRDPGTGQVLDNVSVSVPHAGWKYVLNVLEATAYRKGEVVYQIDRPAPPPAGRPPVKEQRIQDKWIDVSTVRFLFEQPPEKMKGMSGNHEYLQRVAP